MKRVSLRRSVTVATAIIITAHGCATRQVSDTPARAPNPKLAAQTSGTTQLLQAVSVLSEEVAWVSGHGGTYARTVDGGRTWSAGVVLGADTLQFRDVHAVSASTAFLLSAGPGELSTIYKTTDAGAHWARQFVNREADGFFDCMDFWDEDRGLAFSDAVDGHLYLIRTTNGGADWNRIPRAGLPPALDGEGGFAASGTCLVTNGDRYGWIGTGSGGAARVFRTVDSGDTWEVFETPIVSGTNSSGVISLLFSDERNGIALGGDIADQDNFTDNVAVTSDGGETWTLAGRPTFTGAVYGASLVPGADGFAVAVGPQGASYTVDGAATWAVLDTLNYWAVGMASRWSGWAVGPGGRITRISLY